jgi:ATP-dependent DNA helicase DinG
MSENGKNTSDSPVLSSWFAELSRLFSESGAIAQAAPNYRPRQVQIQMAQEIASAIHEHKSLIVEAGTGTGKTFAYLVPALLWGGKVIISTGTKTLQDQLYERDLPAVCRALNVPVNTALLKGRSNYLCHYWLERAAQEGHFSSREDIAYLRKLQKFIKLTTTGDKSEQGDIPENAPIWSHVTSTRDNCLGSDCPYNKECFVLQARRNAQQADVVVVNHHLFFADVMLRDEGMAEFLPAANTIIFDEAHQLPETATLFFGDSLSTSQLIELTRDVQVEGMSQARDAARWPEVVAPLEKAARDLRLVFGSVPAKLSLLQVKEKKGFDQALLQVQTTLADLVKILELNAERSEGLKVLLKRAESLRQLAEQWNSEASEEEIAWVDVFASSVQLHRSPLSIAPIFQRERDSYPRAWIFTSATLAVGDNFSLYAQQLGLQEAVARSWPSPFDFEQQALLYVPQFMPDPQHPDFTEAVVEQAWPLIHAAQGRAFVLCTSLRAVDRIAELLQARLEQTGLTLLKQGDMTRTELLQRFRNDENSVLVASQSFWEGVDVRGQALSLVVIDKLPFAPPDDPVLSARLNKIEREGGNPFIDYQVPAAAITLKQGAGRLIRSESDTGVLMICDPRLVTKAYGKLLWRSLPAFRRTRAETVAVDFLRHCLSTP